MITNLFSRRTLTGLLCLSLLFGLCGPIDFTPSAQAATSAQKRKLRKLKKDNRKLKKQNQMLRIDLAAALAASGTPPALPTTPFIEMVTVGNPGNGADPINSGSVPGIGAVADPFKIGKYEVTNAQYAAFLNAVAAEDTNGLYDALMGTDPRGGIAQFGSTGNFRYAARTAMNDKPVNFVSFWDACRFCNWLHNGRPSGPQGAATTEFGAYDLTVASAITNNTVVRSPGAKFFIPAENQWYKAAYHQPATAGGDADNFWIFP